MKLKTIIDEILTDIAPMKRVGTQLMYQRYLGDIRDDLGERELDGFTRKNFLDWIHQRRCKRPMRSYFNDYTKFMNIIYNFAHDNNYINRAVKFPMVDGEREMVGRVYTTQEINALLKVFSDTMLLQFFLSFECFMRLREMLHLTWDRVDLTKRVIILRKTDVKTGSRNGVGRDVPISANALRMLITRKKGTASKWVFPNPYGSGYANSNKTAWTLAKKRAGIVGRARWHDIRHTAISYAILELKLPIAHVSKIAGVSMRTIERVYLHHDTEQLRFVSDQMNILKKKY